MKKTNFLKKCTAVASFMLLLSSCNKIDDFGTTNVNPNGSSSAQSFSLLAAAEARLGSRTYARADAAAETTAGFFAQYFAEPTYPGLSLYTNPQVSAQGFYAGLLEDLKTVINLNT